MKLILFLIFHHHVSEQPKNLRQKCNNWSAPKSFNGLESVVKEVLRLSQDQQTPDEPNMSRFDSHAEKGKTSANKTKSVEDAVTAEEQSGGLIRNDEWMIQESKNDPGD